MTSSAAPTIGFESAPKPLRAFYGASDRLTTNENTVKTLIGSPDTDRPQEIYTPPAIRDFLVQLWGAIRLDPCSGPESILRAERTYQGRLVPTGRVKKNGQPVTEWEGEGLIRPWMDCTYFNPPYADLDEWLAKAVAEAALGHDIAGLIPVRTHRTWWRHAVLVTADAVGWCNPVSFVGYDSSFPAPLAMPYWGSQPHEFAALFDMCGLGSAEVRNGKH